ncbi:MAG: aspartate kinase [Coriobacteriia bacterium]|nr:aspartate kinase [Coriobacteriia bacterium]
MTKFGGTSVATPEKIRAVAERLVARKKAGDEVVAIVSAMGHVTDELTEMAYAITDTPRMRELDMLLSTGEQVTIALLAMAIHELGERAISFTGPQVGIVTDDAHAKAKIVEIEATAIREALAADNIVIVAGFQGSTRDGEITTLGRGGSDTTAAAIATGIDADVCEIYTDVDGVYTADPRVVPRAQKIDRISHEEMLEMAASGAGVLSMRSVEFARNHDAIIHCRSSFTSEPGTIVTHEETTMENAIVSSVVHDMSDAKVTLRGLEDKPGVAATIFDMLARENVNVDMVIQNISEEGLTDLSFTAPHDDLQRVKTAIDAIAQKVGARTWVLDDNIAKISLIGAGMRTHPGVTAKMFRTLADEDINIDLISTSPIRLSVVVATDDTERAVRALHTAFGLDHE